MATSSSFLLDENFRNAIDAEVSTQSAKLRRLEDTRSTAQRQISAYEEIRTRVDSLNQASKALYSYNSPFRHLVGVGDGVGEFYDVFANRNAQKKSEHTIEVTSVAASQKFASKPFAMTENIASGTISITAGTNGATLNFEGGTLVQFKRAFDKEFKDIIKTTIVQKTKNLQVMIFEVVKTGANNSVQVYEDTANILEPLNLFSTTDYRHLNYKFSTQSVADIRDLSENLSTNYFLKNDFLIMEGVNKISLPMRSEVMGDTPLTLSLTTKLQDIGMVDSNFVPEDLETVVIATNLIEIPDVDVDRSKVDGVSFADISIEGESISPFELDSAFKNAKDYNDYLLNQDGEVVAPAYDGMMDYNVIGLKYIDAEGLDKEKYYAIPSITAAWQRLSIELTPRLTDQDIITDIIIINNNKDKSLYLKDLLIEEKGRIEYVANYPIGDGKDARIIIDGVEVASESNDIQNALDGINVAVKKVTDSQKSFMVDIDKDKVAGVIIDFVSTYNYTLEFLSTTLSKPLDKDVMKSLDDMSRSQMLDIAIEHDIGVGNDVSDDVLRRYLGFIGIFSGSSVISTFKQKIQTLVISPYPTAYGGELTLLSQIGISRGEIGASWSDISAGYLQIEEDKFLEKLETLSDGVEELFASYNDTEAPLPNDGVAIKMSETAEYYSRTRGIFDTTVQASKEQIMTYNRQIETERERVDKYRSSREAIYYRMSAELKNAERDSKSLENRFNSMSNNK